MCGHDDRLNDSCFWFLGGGCNWRERRGRGRRRREQSGARRDAVDDGPQGPNGMGMGKGMGRGGRRGQARERKPEDGA